MSAEDTRTPPTERIVQLFAAEADEWSGPEQRAELLELLRRDPAARAVYIEQAILHSLLFQKTRRGEGLPSSLLEIVSPGPQSARSSAASPGFLGGMWQGAAGYLSQHPMTLGYLVASVCFAVAIGISSLIYVSHDYVGQVANLPYHDGSPASTGEPEMEVVGRVTGQADCRWNGPETFPSGGPVPLGRKYALAAGLMEITYETGAKVILEGPCTYEVDSARGGFLSLGKLTARVETKGEGGRRKAEGTDNQKSEIGSQKSPFALPPSAFIVRTPTAVVTDLGTEFGVEVSKEGTTTSHVFRGRVEVRVTGGGTRGQSVVTLGENQSVRVEADRERIVRVTRLAGGEASRGRFARQMPRRIPIELFSTGIGLKEGAPDPHWQIVARSDDPDFKPRPAVVTSYDDRQFLAADALQSQWLSTANGSPELPNGVTYTFRTTFELSGLFRETASLHGWFIADNHVNAIRLNGKPSPVPMHGDNSFGQPHDFSIRSGFAEGTNVLEIDVYNGSAVDTRVHRNNSPMLLRVELQGSYVGGDGSTAREGPAAEPQGKEGAAMN